MCGMRRRSSPCDWRTTLSCQIFKYSIVCWGIIIGSVLSIYVCGRGYFRKTTTLGNKYLGSHSKEKSVVSFWVFGLVFRIYTLISWVFRDNIDTKECVRLSKSHFATILKLFKKGGNVFCKFSSHVITWSILDSHRAHEDS